jgi:predicted PurR-regulated permease PerM
MSGFIASLKPYQRNLLASAVALLASVIIVGFLFGIFLILKAFTTNFASVLWPLAAAGILAMILRPIVFWFQRRLRFGRTFSILFIYLLLLIFVALIAAWILPVLFAQTVGFLERLPVIVGNLRSALVEHFPAVEQFLIDTLGQTQLDSFKTQLIDLSQQMLDQAPKAIEEVFSTVGFVVSTAAGLAIVPVYLFFFLKSDRDVSVDLEQQLSFMREDWRKDIIFLIREFVGSIEAFFRGQILIGFILGVMLAVLFTLIGVNFGIGLGLLIGALNIIPYLGTIVGLGLVLPIAYFQPEGGWVVMLLALGAFFLTQLIEGYLLTPRIMGKQTGLHPLTIIIAIFFWGVALDGLLGMILAIPLTAFFVVAWRLAKKKYLRYFSGEAFEEAEVDEGDQVPESALSE